MQQINVQSNNSTPAGTYVSKLALQNVPGGGYNIVALQWYNGCNGYEEGDTYCLCIALDVGRSVCVCACVCVCVFHRQEFVTVVATFVNFGDIFPIFYDYRKKL